MSQDGADTRLRSWIPIAAAARREAADGSEARLRPVFGFEPRWYHVRCGVDFTERWHTDPEYRRQTLVAMRGELRRAFPRFEQWGRPEAQDTETIAGCYGVCVIPALFGIPLRYYADRWPDLEPGHHLSEDCIERLDARQLLAGPFVEKLLAQVDAIAARCGTVYGDLNWQGVLNLGFHLRGQQIFLDMADRPELAERLFTTITDVIIGLAHMAQERQRRSGFPIDYMCVSNCAVNMVSPAVYGRMLLAQDARIADSFARFGVHTCNWNVTPYLDVLRRLPKMGYLDMGIESDMVRARDVFPEARRAVLYTPGKAAAGDPEMVRADFERIARDLAPCDVVLADLPWDIPDERVRWLEALARETGAQR
ncbi:MAG: hypothetical protein LLG20_17840 [Acidobacteriales bacterium]|nr:hypothetical protein [Terriglobales bacterium]